MGYKIVCDSACDLPMDYIEKNEIDLVHCYCSLDGETYLKDGVDIHAEELFQLMIKKEIFPKTALPSVQDYMDVFEKSLNDGISIICICMASKLSGSYQSAMVARNILLEKYTTGSIFIIDSQVDTVVQGLLIRECVKMQQLSLHQEKVIEQIDLLIETIHSYFFIDNIKYLIKGGRAHNLLKLCNITIPIKPILTLKGGEHKLLTVSRGKKKALHKIVEYVRDYFAVSKENPNDYSWCIGVGLNVDDANELKKAIEEELDMRINIEIQKIGVVIASHTGPYLVGIAFMKKMSGGRYASL